MTTTTMKMRKLKISPPCRIKAVKWSHWALKWMSCFKKGQLHETHSLSFKDRIFFSLFSSFHSILYTNTMASYCMCYTFLDARKREKLVVMMIDISLLSALNLLEIVVLRLRATHTLYNEKFSVWTRSANTKESFSQNYVQTLVRSFIRIFFLPRSLSFVLFLSVFPSLFFARNFTLASTHTFFMP